MVVAKHASKRWIPREPLRNNGDDTSAVDSRICMYGTNCAALALVMPVT
jgi:hypothetical protein